MKFLLDTCVLSELVKSKPEPSVLAWINTRKESELHVAAMTLGELQRGVARLPLSRRKTELTDWLEKLRIGFEGRIFPFTAETAVCWGEMCARAESDGRTLAAFDSIIAATAMEHRLVLVTRNEQDFSKVPIALINPWHESQKLV